MKAAATTITITVNGTVNSNSTVDICEVFFDQSFNASFWLTDL